MKIDFSALNLVCIESNVAPATPDIFINQNSVTFTRKLLEVLNYPAHVLVQLDAKNRVFAVRACKSNEQRAFKFSKPKGEQQPTLVICNKNLMKPIRECTADIWEPKKRYKISGFWVADAKTMCFDLNEAVPKSYFSEKRQAEVDDE